MKTTLILQFQLFFSLQLKSGSVQPDSLHCDQVFKKNSS